MIEHDGILHELRVLERLLIEDAQRFSGLPTASQLLVDPNALTERRQVAPQLLEGVEEVRHPLLDHEGVERQVPSHVGAIVDEVPHDEGPLGESRVIDHPGGLRGQLELRDLGSCPHDATVPGGLSVLEDRSPREGGDLSHRDGLGKQDS